MATPASTCTSTSYSTTTWSSLSASNQLHSQENWPRHWSLYCSSSFHFVRHSHFRWTPSSLYSICSVSSSFAHFAYNFILKICFQALNCRLFGFLLERSVWFWSVDLRVLMLVRLLVFGDGMIVAAKLLLLPSWGLLVPCCCPFLSFRLGFDCFWWLGSNWDLKKWDLQPEQLVLGHFLEILESAVALSFFQFWWFQRPKLRSPMNRNSSLDSLLQGWFYSTSSLSVIYC